MPFQSIECIQKYVFIVTYLTKQPKVFCDFRIDVYLIYSNCFTVSTKKRNVSSSLFKVYNIWPKWNKISEILSCLDPIITTIIWSDSLSAIIEKLNSNLLALTVRNL